MNPLIISLGEQNFLAVEDLNNAAITNYVIFFQLAHFRCRKSLTKGK